MSIARRILKEKESEGAVVPYIREGGFVVYTTPSELEKREGGAPIVVADALEEIASSVPKEPVITEEMDLALAAASSPELVKPSKLARKRREAGEKKERKDTRPEVIVEPLEVIPSKPETKMEREEEEEIPKKKVTRKRAPKKEEKKAAPKKKEEKKAAPKKDEKKAAPKKDEKKAAPKKDEKKAAPKKKTEKKEAPKKDEKKAAPKKKTEKKEAPKKKTTKKKADESQAGSKTATKKK